MKQLLSMPLYTDHTVDRSKGEYMLTVLTLMLASTSSFRMIRDELRKRVIVTEVNALGTAC